MSEDILAGKRIDSTTEGPLPKADYGRMGNILEDQRISQRDNAIAGIEQAPKIEPPQPIEVSEPPPLPQIPTTFSQTDTSSFFGESPFPKDDSTREIARQVTFDVLKKMTINGVQPSIDGSGISFDIPSEPPASIQFQLQNQPETFKPSPSQSADIQSLKDTSATIEPKQQNMRMEPDRPSGSALTGAAVKESLANLNELQATITSLNPEPPKEYKDADTIYEFAAGQNIDDIYKGFSRAFDEAVSLAQATTASRPTGAEAITDIPKSTYDSSVKMDSPLPAAQDASFNLTTANSPPKADFPSVMPAEKARDPKEYKAEDPPKPKSSQDMRLEEFTQANENIAPLVKFRVCVDGKTVVFLIPAFGPYPETL